MKKLLSTTLMLLAALATMAQNIDFNMSGRNDEEVNEPNYIGWAVPTVASDSKTLDNGMTLTVSASAQADVLRAQWNKNVCSYGKNGISNLRLLGDGVQAFKLDHGNNTPEPKDFPTGITLTIEGMQPGQHTLIAYHHYRDPNATLPKIQVAVNGTVVQTVGYTSNPGTNTQKLSEVASSFAEFTVTEGQPVVITYTTLVESDVDYTSTSVTINGLEFDTNPYLAQDPIPDNYDYHAEADHGAITLLWTPSAVAARHKLVFGTDSAEVADAASYQYEGTDNSYEIMGVSPLQRYYWRVDEEESNGTVHHGKVWTFQPRRLAFPGAEGYGRFAIGGRGGSVYHVTTLDDNGDDDNPIEGSFRYGITKARGPRTIVFDVAGVISLKSRLTCSDKFVTIAGQTAPAQGIMLSTCPFGMQSDGITRFLRMRLGHKRLVNGTIPKEDVATAYGDDYGKLEETTLSGLDGMGMSGNDQAIMDHCSISWTIDEGFSSRNAKGITLQRTLISEALNQAGHPNYSAGTKHGYAATIGAGQMGGQPGSFHHNLLVHNEGRNWSISGGLDGKGNYDGAHDVFNNVVYNWSGRTTDGGTHEMNFVNNYYKAGPSMSRTELLLLELEGTGTGTQSAYVSGNIREEKNGTKTHDALGNTYQYRLTNGQELTWQPFVSKPFFPSYATIESAEAAYKNVLSDAGCNQPFFDLHDQRMVSETKNRTTTTKGSRTGKAGLIDSEEDTGCEGFHLEKLGLTTAQRDTDWDTDEDGIPDWFESITGTNPSAANHNDDRDGDYYTDLEEYLNWTAAPNFRLTSGEQITIDLKAYFAGYDNPDYEASPETDDGNSWTINGQGQLLFTTTKGMGSQLSVMTVTATENGISLTREFHFAISGGNMGIVSIVGKSARKGAPTYDIQGRRVMQPTAKGVYIRDGQKFVVR